MMTQPIQMFLVIAWQKNGTPDRNIRYGEVTMHVGDLLDPPPTKREMQDIAFAAKMAFARVCQARKKEARLKRPRRIQL